MGKMLDKKKVLATKPDDRSSIPIVEGENYFCELFSDRHMNAVACAHTRTHTIKSNKCSVQINLKKKKSPQGWARRNPVP